jgi:putative tricarboxylic transport membrane protein
MRITLFIEVIVVIIIGLVSIIEGIRLTTVEKIQPEPLGPDLYNVGIGLILITLGFTYFISQLRKVPKREKRATEEKATEKEYRQYKITMISMIVVMVIYIFLINLIGYLFASAVFFFLINRVAGFRSWLTNLASTTIMTVSYYVIFVKWMGMIFPRGVLLNF